MLDKSERAACDDQECHRASSSNIHTHQVSDMLQQGTLQQVPRHSVKLQWHLQKAERKYDKTRTVHTTKELPPSQPAPKIPRMIKDGEDATSQQMVPGLLPPPQAQRQCKC